jgi:FkbM family methyltransferase
MRYPIGALATGRRLVARTASVWFRDFVLATARRLPLGAAEFCLRSYRGIARSFASSPMGHTYFGARIPCDTRDLVQRTILQFGIWEPEVSKVIEQTLRPGDVFVDVGANVGYHTLLGSHLVGSQGSVIALEALPATFALLERNLVLNAARNVRAVNVAVSGEPGEVSIYGYNAVNIGAASTLASRGGPAAATVKALPLTAILTAEERSRVKLIKMDIEGAEPDVLNEIFDNFHLFPPTMSIIVEATPSDGAGTWTSLFERFRSLGFRAYAVANFYDTASYLRWRRPTALTEIDRLSDVQQDLLWTRSPPLQPPAAAR